VKKHIERLWEAWCWHVITLDDCFVGLAATSDIIRLDGKDLLECMGGAECFERLDFHLTETLATKLCLTTKSLLGDE
jgi:hypothetical protein